MKNSSRWNDTQKERFENSICNAKRKLEEILGKIERLLSEENVKYYIPPVSQQNEEELEAVFSFKYAAVLIDAALENGVKIAESRCPADCTKCIDICPPKALTGNIWNISAK